jgi:hypothetical protein
LILENLNHLPIFQLNIDEKDADNLYNQLETLYQGFKLKYRHSKTNITTQGHVTEMRNGFKARSEDELDNEAHNGYQNGIH